MDHGTKAAELFLQGYNCAQAVAAAFSDLTGMDEKTSARMVSAFGGGVGGLREVCGAVSGMAFVLGQLYGYSDPSADTQKKALYALVQQLTGEFKEQTGTVVCRELLKNIATSPVPAPRTPEYYAERPCARFVLLAGQILDRYIEQNPPA